MSRAASLFFALLGIILISCASVPSIDDIPAGQTAPDQLAGAQPSQFPAGLPDDGVQPWENLDADGHVIPAGRTASSINLDTDFTPGVERFLDSGDAADNLEATRLNGNDGNSTAYAMYRISMGSEQPGIVSVDANLLSGKGYYVGLSNYGTNRWDWRGPFMDNHVRLQAVTEPSGELTSPFGNTFVTVLCPAGTGIDVVGIGINQYDPASPTAPATPLGLTSTPVPGGLELSWSPVLDSDLAGYAIYYSTSPFSTTDSAGVQRVDYLEGSARHLLGGLVGETFVGLTAVDFGGAESPLAGSISATPLDGSVPGLRLTASSVSGGLGSPIILTASGAASYDWDRDGDGIFEVAGDTTGTQPAGTSATGLVRPRVRGTAGEAVALGGISLLVTANSRPVASATASPQSGPAPLDVNFTGLAEDLEDEGSALTYAWDFDGDGIYEPGTDTLSPDPASYPDPGLFNAKFRVTDSEAAWDVDTLAIQVNPAGNLPPVVVFEFTSQHGDSADGLRNLYLPQDGGISVSFNAHDSTDPEGGSLTWHFDAYGDGEFETQSNGFFSEFYTQPGVVRPTIIVEDQAGNTGTAAFLIDIHRFSGRELTDPGRNISASSMAMIAGIPAIAYQDNSQLYYVRALDARGRNWVAPVLVTDAGTSGEISLLELDGLPAIAYQYLNNIHFIRADSEDGSAWAAPVTVEDHPSDVLLYPSMAIIGGRPAVSYYNTTANKVRYARAGDATGSSWSLLTDVDTDTGTDSSRTRLKLISGRPAILYNHSTDDDLYFLRANDATGTDWNSAARVLVTDFVGDYYSLDIANGIPVVAYDGFDPFFCAAQNSTGSSWHAPRRIDQSGAGHNVGDYMQILVLDDHMVAFHRDIADDDVRISYSSGLTEDSWPSYDIKLDGIGDLGYHIGAFVLDGRPALCYESNGDGVLRFAYPELY